MWLKPWQSDGMSYKKDIRVAVLPVVDLCKKSAKLHFFVGSAIQVVIVTFHDEGGAN